MIFWLRIFWRRRCCAPSRFVLTTLFPSLPTGGELTERYFVDGEKGSCTVRVVWYAPRSSDGALPLRRRTASRKITCGCVGLLGSGVAERRRHGCLDLGISPSLQIYDWREGHTRAAIACDENVLQGGDVVDALELTPGGGAPR